MIEPPAGWWLIPCNIAAWATVHLGVAWVGTRLPGALFSPQGILFRPRAFERGPILYERILRVRQWKGLLPDGAALFRGGVRKKSLGSRDASGLALFARETCRGEAVHWVVFLAGLSFFLWNPWWAGLANLAYAAAANLPCIAAQRYNRIRLLRARAKKQPATPGDAGCSVRAS